VDGSLPTQGSCFEPLTDESGSQRQASQAATDQQASFALTTEFVALQS
jgi:hypothetical protein